MKRPDFSLKAFTAVLAIWIICMPSCSKKEEDIPGSPPTCTILAPADESQFVQGDTITVSVRAEGSEAEISYIRIYIDDVIVTECAGDICMIDYPTEGKEPGTHYIRAVCMDKSGEESVDEHSFTLLTELYPPTAEFSLNHIKAEVLVDFFADASYSTDPEDLPGKLEVRWDWESDGIWDTRFSTVKTAAKSYVDTGDHVISLQVRDTDGLTNITSKTVRTEIPGEPCPGLPVIEYAGQAYHTIYINQRCWFRDNLNVGVQVNSGNPQDDNGIVEKYCYEDQASNCTEYGGLYQWDELMAYDSIPGGQGICPPGWHVPTDQEWCDMLQNLDPGTSCTELNVFTGSDGAGKLKETGYTHWQSPNYGAVNSSGFTAIASGIMDVDDHGYGGLKFSAHFWTSSHHSEAQAIKWQMVNEFSRIKHASQSKADGLSVRCIKDSREN